MSIYRHKVSLARGFVGFGGGGGAGDEISCEGDACGGGVYCIQEEGGLFCLSIYRHATDRSLFSCSNAKIVPSHSHRDRCLSCTAYSAGLRLYIFFFGFGASAPVGSHDSKARGRATKAKQLQMSSSGWCPGPDDGSRAETSNPDKHCEAEKALHCMSGSVVSGMAATVWASDVPAGHRIGPSVAHGAGSV